MDSSEKIAEQLLRNMGFRTIVFEPDGNIPPDFVIDGRIAVEVRRLNKSYDSGDGLRGLEETFYPLWQKIERLAHSFGPTNGESWFISFSFSRPLPQWGHLNEGIRVALRNFMGQSHRSNRLIYEQHGFQLRVSKASKPLEHYFCMGSGNDHQAGGFVVADMLENIQHCSDQKLRKISRVKARYKIWWLVLPDYIGLGLSSDDRVQFLSHAKRLDGWDKIIIVNPLDPSKWFEF